MENLGGQSTPRFGDEVRHITNIRTMCETLNKTPVSKTLLGEVYKLLSLYLTFPVALATSERTFFALRRLKNYLRTTMKQDRLNKSLLMHCQKSITDTPWALLRLQRGLLVPTNYAKDILDNFSRGMPLAWCTMSPPPPPPRFKTLRRLYLSTKIENSNV